MPAAKNMAALTNNRDVDPCRRSIPQKHSSPAAAARQASSGVRQSCLRKTPSHNTGRPSRRLPAVACAWKRQSERVEFSTCVRSSEGSSSAAKPKAHMPRVHSGISASARNQPRKSYPPDVAIQTHSAQGVTSVTARAARSQNGCHTVSLQ